MISFYFAGIDTTGHLVALSIYSLAEYPEYKKRIISEIHTFIKSPEDITYDNLQVKIIDIIETRFSGKVLRLVFTYVATCSRNSSSSRKRRYANWSLSDS